MTIAEIVALILSGMGALGGLWATLAKSKTEAAAQIVTGYGALCDDLQAQIKANNDELTRLRADLAALREEREEWQRERADLVKRIEDLESENRLLKRKIEKFQKEYCVGG